MPVPNTQADREAEMLAFDRLPGDIRAAVAYSPFNVDARSVARACAGGFHLWRIPEMLENTARKHVAAEDMRWRSRFGCRSPHVASGVSVLRTDPIEGKRIAVQRAVARGLRGRR